MKPIYFWPFIGVLTLCRTGRGPPCKAATIGWICIALEKKTHRALWRVFSHRFLAGIMTGVEKNDGLGVNSTKKTRIT